MAFSHPRPSNAPSPAFSLHALAQGGSLCLALAVSPILPDPLLPNHKTPAAASSFIPGPQWFPSVSAQRIPPEQAGQEGYLASDPPGVSEHV